MRRFLARWAYSILAFAVLAYALGQWAVSARWSERHILPLANRSAEIFSASSLLRVSFADGVIGGGRQTGYRHRNARGRMQFRPLAPELRIGHGLIELTLGYWHLAVLAFAGTLLAVFVDWRRGVLLRRC